MRKRVANLVGEKPTGNEDKEKLDFFNDVVFKKIFRNEDDKEPLVTFLNDALKYVLTNKIVKIELKNSEMQPSFTIDGRVCLVDILCTDERGDFFLIEIQLSPQHFMANRMLYYTCGLHIESGKRGDQKFKNVKSVYSICIANFVIWKEEDFLVNFKMRSDKNINCVIDGITIIFLQIPKLKDKFAECRTDIERLIYAMLNYDSMTYEEIQKLKESHQDILSKMTNLHLTPDEYLRYLSEQNAMWATIDSYETATSMGLAEGMEKGMQQGLEKGREQGIEEGIVKGIEEGMQVGKQQGIEEGKIEIIKALKAANADINLIMAATGLTIEEVELI